MSIAPALERFLSRRHAGMVGPGAAPVPVNELWRRARELAAALPPRAVRSDRKVRTAARGAHGRRRAGPGDSFWQFRPHHAGEPASAIDWRRSARSDALYVRQHEWETSQNIWFWFDGSASMHFRSPPARDSKADRALLLGLAAASLVVGAGERIAFYGADARAAGGSYGLARLLATVERERLRESDAFPPSTPLPAHAHLVLVGDFLGEEADLRAGFERLTALGVRGHLLQVMDPAEADFPFAGRVFFEGLEDEERILLDRADEMAVLFRRRMAAWSESLGAMCRRAGWTHSVHRTDHSAASALIALMSLLGRDA